MPLSIYMFVDIHVGMNYMLYICIVMMCYFPLQDGSDTTLNSDDDTQYIEKKLLELKNGTHKVFVNGTFKCPFDDKLQNCEKDSLIEHAVSTSNYGRTSRIRARHVALVTYMLDGATDPTKKNYKRTKKH